MLSGKHITHIALPLTNLRERTARTKSFLPKRPSLSEDSVLTTVRPVFYLRELYNQWTEHRVEIAKEQYRRLVKKTGGRKQVGREFDIEGVRAQIEVLRGPAIN